MTEARPTLNLDLHGLVTRERRVAGMTIQRLADGSRRVIHPSGHVDVQTREQRQDIRKRLVEHLEEVRAEIAAIDAEESDG